LRLSFLTTILLSILLTGLAENAHAALPCAAQSAKSADEPAPQVTLALPKDSAALMSVAQKLNGLAGDGLRPRHLKVSYQTFDDKTHSHDSGVYEEWWIAANKYKRTYTSSTFSQTDFGTDHGLFRIGNQNWPGPLELMVQLALLDPIPAVLNFQGIRLESKRRSINKANLQCVTLTGDWIFLVANGYCFDSDKPIVRYISAFGDRSGTMYNSIVSFGGHFVARDITVTEGGKPQLIIHLELLEGVAAVNGSDFTPPAEAVQVSSSNVSLPQSTMRALLLRQVPPHYPVNAKTSHVQGTVVLQIKVGKDGHAAAAHAISGPSALQKEAADAVLNWEYRPFLISGEPIDVESEVHIVFTLGG